MPGVTAPSRVRVQNDIAAAGPTRNPSTDGRERGSGTQGRNACSRGPPSPGSAPEDSRWSSLRSLIGDREDEHGEERRSSLLPIPAPPPPPRRRGNTAALSHGYLRDKAAANRWKRESAEIQCHARKCSSTPARRRPWSSCREPAARHAADSN